MGDYQSGFRGGRSTIDQIHSLRQILEKCLEHNINTYHLFVDFRSAYDCIKREALYEAMVEFGIPHKLVRLVKATMTNVRSRVRVEQDLSTPFHSRTGLRQGDALACLLFNIALEKVVRASRINTSGNIFHKSVQILAYADDIDIIGRTPEDIREAFLALEDSAKRMGLRINEDKTKLMISSPTATLNQTTHTFNAATYRFEIVNSFVYLGSLVNAHNNTTEEIQKRIMAASRCYYGLIKQLQSRNLSRTTKSVLYKTLIRPVLTYASETWVLSKTNERQLAVFERKILRKIYGPLNEGGVWRRRYNQELYDLYRDPDVIQVIKISRLRWAGHIIRMNEEAQPRRLTLTHPEGRRRAGRPKLRWMDGVNADAGAIGLRSWRSAALRRTEWRKSLDSARVHPGLSC